MVAIDAKTGEVLGEAISSLVNVWENTNREPVHAVLERGKWWPATKKQVNGGKSVKVVLRAE